MIKYRPDSEGSALEKLFGSYQSVVVCIVEEIFYSLIMSPTRYKLGGFVVAIMNTFNKLKNENLKTAILQSNEISLVILRYV